MEVSDNMEQLRALSQFFCQMPATVPVVLVTSTWRSFSLLRELNFTGDIGISHNLGSLSPFHLHDLGRPMRTIDLIQPEMLLLNPWTAYFLHRTNKRVVALPAFPNDETYLMSAGLAGGAESVIVRDVQQVLRGLNLTKFDPRPVMTVNMSTPFLFDVGSAIKVQYFATSVPFAVRWGIACGVGPLVFILMVGVAVVKKGKKEIMDGFLGTQEAKRVARRGIVVLIEVLCCV
ncbi:hypothetical protein BC829DRAFT_486725, partial [Chytridium lagenaria]